MDRQMDIFDFIEQPPFQTQFEQLFERVKDPVFLCANCLCEYCVNNAEQSRDKVKQGEMLEPCFNCDECRIYDGDCRLRNQRKEECMNFVMSDYGARRNRRKFKVIKGFGGEANGKNTSDSVQHRNGQSDTGRQEDSNTASYEATTSS